jgi:hypothetical protein
MWKTTKFTTKKISKTLDKGMDSIFESFNSACNQMNELFEDADLDDDEDETEDLKCASFSTLSDNGTIRITNNNGHIVIDGSLKSLKVNGVDYDTLLTNPLRE